MKFLGRFFIASVILLGLFAALVLLFTQLYLGPLIKSQIVTKGSELIQGSVNLENVRIKLFPQFRLVLEQLRVQRSNPSMDLQIVSITAQIPTAKLIGLLDGRTSIGPLEVIVENPKLHALLRDQQGGTQPSSQAAPTTSQAIALPDLLATLTVNNAEVLLETLDAQNQSKQVQIDLPQLTARSQGWAQPLELKAGMKVSLLKGYPLALHLPVTIHSHIMVNPEFLKTESTQLNLAGMALSLNGYYNLKTQKGQLRFGSNLPDISSIPAQQQVLPGKWSGAISASGWLSNEVSKGWSFKGQAQFSDIKGSTQFEQAGIRINGDLQASLNAAFEGELGSWYKLPLLQMQANLTNSELSYQLDQQVIFQKPKTTQLNFDLLAEGDAAKFELKRLSLVFYNARLSSTATWQAANNQFSTQLSLERTQLNGWESFFPVLRSSPVQGLIEVKAQAQGFLNQPDSIQIRLNPLTLSNLSTQINWADQSKKRLISGPVRIDGNLIATLVGKKINGAQFRLSSDLTGLRVQWDDMINKSAGQILRVRLNGSESSGKLVFNSSNFTLGSSQLGLSGSLAEPFKPELNLAMKLNKIHSSDLTALLPKLKASLPSFSASGQLGLLGQFDPELGIERSPLKLTGKVEAQIPSYKYESAKTTSPPGKLGNEPPNKVPEAFLPSWPIFQHSQLQAQIRLGLLEFNGLQARDLTASTQYHQGLLKGDGRVGNLFHGRVVISSLQVPMLTPDPLIKTQLEVFGIDVNQALTWLSSEWKDLVKGSATGAVSASFALPSSPGFLQKLSSKFKVKLSEAFVSTLSLDQLINEKLASIPGLGSKEPLNTKGVAGTVSLSGELNGGKVQIEDFNFLSPEKNEIQAKGSLEVPTKNMDLAATAYLVNAPVGGSIREANSDSLGRLVIPVRMQGNLLKPDISIATDIVTNLLKKTAEYESNKAKKALENRAREEAERAKQQAQGEINKKVDELKKRVEQEGLKGILGN